MKNRFAKIMLTVGLVVGCGGSGEDSLFGSGGTAGQPSGGQGGVSNGVGGVSSSSGGSSSSVGGSSSSSGGATGTGGATGSGGHAGAMGSGGNGQGGGGGSATAGASGSPGDAGPVDASGTGGSGQIDSGGATDAGSGPCPVMEPTQHDPCPRVNLVCEYGSDPRGDTCRDHATCTGDGWKVSQVGCKVLPPTDCPATRAQAQGAACDPAGAYCTYEEGLSCACTNCSTGGPIPLCTQDPTWHCEAPNSNPACPAAPPNEGLSCAPESLACTYHCGPNGRRICAEGVWTATTGGPCPVSTRTAKQAIEYLTDEDLARVASDLRRFRLATYEYKDPALAGRRHLGFIIEDNPESPAVDRGENMVDLYGYASMLVAAMQTQSKEIANLKREVTALKRRRP